jgi:ribosome-associated heat shock protein Hsp15
MNAPDLRLDKWLWHARFARTRDKAAELIAGRRVRVNGQIATKTHQKLRRGDVVMLTAPQAIRVVRVLDFGQRRGPATDAVGLYETLTMEAD